MATIRSTESYNDSDLAFAAFRFIGVMGGILDTIGASQDLNAAEVLAIHWLSRKPASVGEIARLIGMHENGASVLVKRLTERGLVTRRRSRTDRRVVTVGLSISGKSVAANQARELRQQSSRTFAALETPERKTLTSLLEAIARFRYEPSRAVYVCFKDDLLPAALAEAPLGLSRVNDACQQCTFLPGCSVSDGHRGRRPYVHSLFFESVISPPTTFEE